MDIDRQKITQNITTLLPKASSKQLLLFYQLLYQVVKKA